MDKTFDSREVFEALNAWAKTNPRGYRTGGGRDGDFDFIQLHCRPDERGPEVQLTFRAVVADGRPVIRVQLPASGQSHERASRSEPSVQVLGVLHDPLMGREPDAVCEGCNAIGTVGRATRTDASGEAREVHRFCFDCWPEHSARYRARWTEENRRRSDRFLRGLEPARRGPGPGMSFEAATWHNTLDIVRKIERMMIAAVPPSAGDLEHLAAQIQASAPQLEGEMPFEIEAFIRRYGARTG